MSNLKGYKQSKSPISAAAKKQLPAGSGVLVRREMQQFRSGPIPDPETLRQYGEILPGLPERIMAKTETEQKHRHEIAMESLILADRHHRIDTNTYRAGQWLGLLAVLGVVALCAYMVHEGHSEDARWLGVGTLAALAAVFITDRSRKAKEKEQTSNEDKRG